MFDEHLAHLGLLIGTGQPAGDEALYLSLALLRVLVVPEFDAGQFAVDLLAAGGGLLLLVVSSLVSSMPLAESATV